MTEYVIFQIIKLIGFTKAALKNVHYKQMNHLSAWQKSFESVNAGMH